MNRQGFTLVEVMIAGSIMTLAIIGASTQIMQQVTAESQVSVQLQSRLIMNQTIASLLSGANLYPYIYNFTSYSTFVYVSCFRDDGSQIPTINPPTNGAIGVPIIGVTVGSGVSNVPGFTPYPPAPGYYPPIPTGPANNNLGLGTCNWQTPGSTFFGFPTSPCVCMQNQGGYEVHIVPLGSHATRVDVITLTHGYQGQNGGNPSGVTDARGHVVGSRVTSSGVVSM